MKTFPRNAVSGLDAATGVLVLPALCGLFYIGLFIFVALERRAYPFDLEWMEGGVADHVRRILEGKAIYGPPSVEFTPFVYTPFYYYLSALVSSFHGLDLPTLRLVSLTATCGTLVLLFAIVHRETTLLDQGRPGFRPNGARALQAFFAGLAAAGLYAATYDRSGNWFDLARVDALWLVLLLGSTFLLRFHTTHRGLATAALLMTLACATKQSSVLVAGAMSVYSLFALQGLRRLVFPLITFIAILLGGLVANAISDGWFYFYVVEVPRSHSWSLDVTGFWIRDLARAVPVALFFTLIYLLLLLVRREKERTMFYVLIIGSLLLVAWVSRSHSGGYANVLMPAFAAVALGFGLGLSRVWNQPGRPRALGIRVILVALAVAQFARLYYDGRRLVPTEESYAAGRELLQIVRGFSGDVLVPHHGFLTYRAGKPSFAHSMAIFDLTRGTRASPVAVQIETEVRERLLQGSFDAVILDYGAWQEESMQRCYSLGRDLWESSGFSETALFTVTGRHTRPHLLYSLGPEKVARGCRVLPYEPMPEPSLPGPGSR
jgi:hypothetical protein